MRYFYLMDFYHLQKMGQSMGKILSKALSSKYEQKLLGTKIDVLKTDSQR